MTANSALRKAVELRRMAIWTILTLGWSIVRRETLPEAIARLVFVLIFCIAFQMLFHLFWTDDGR